jgi:hypothetical protein
LFAAVSRIERLERRQSSLTTGGFMTKATSVILAVSLLLIGSWKCLGAEPTVPGPEASELVKRLDGHIIWAPWGGEIAALALPSGKQSIVRPADPDDAPDRATIHTLSGPDRLGRIAYIEDHFFVENEAKRRHLLKVIRIDGSGDMTLFSRPGDAMWARNGEIGHQLALSPVGGKVAFLSGLSFKQMPAALFHEGSIEIWDVRSKQQLPKKIAAADQPLAWFPDGKHLAFVRFVPRRRLPGRGVAVEVFGTGSYTGSWEELPAVHILDVDSGQDRFLSLGWIPVVSFDGKAVFVAGWVADASRGIRLIWKRVDVASGTVENVTWPGDAGGLIANPTADLALYWGLTTTGEPIKHSNRGSFRRGLALVTLKVATMNSNRFQTVMAEIDPRYHVSFGAVAPK